MTLYIDTTNFETATLQLRNAEGEIVKQDTFTSEKKLAKQLISRIDKLVKPKEPTHIEVNTHSGSFTGTRIGVSVANALGFALSIPVNALADSTGSDQGGKYAEVVYDKEPNISQPKEKKG